MALSDSFDFVVVGGGLAGLVVAVRLAENSNVTVGVLEAGEDLSQSLKTRVPGFATNNIGNPEVAWRFFTTPQSGANDRSIYLPRGKGLGGSSSLNYMQLGRATAQEYDAFETLGSPGWNWQEFLKYMKKSETLAYSPEDLEQHCVKPDPNFHGTSGPVYKTLPGWINPMMLPFIKACEKLGIPLNTDSANGYTAGVWSTSGTTVHPETMARVSSATAYYEPNKTKENLVVITGARVTRIVFNGQVAEAVEYMKDGELQSVLVKKEVILSAGTFFSIYMIHRSYTSLSTGTFQTPQILELSGIGDEKILRSHGIPVVMNLPGDHWYAPFVVEIDPKIETMDVLLEENKTAEEWKLYDEKKRGMLTVCSCAFAFVPSKSVVNVDAIREIALKFTASRSPHVSAGVQNALNLKREWLEDDRIPFVEFLMVPWATGPAVEKEKHYMTFAVITLHPFSRGNVHIDSTDPLAAPKINANVLDNDADMDLLIGGLKLARKIISIDPITSVVIKEARPGAEIQTDEEFREYIKETLGSTFHPVGTASMLPKEDGGVVDANLKVYGTANLRVVDASIIPIQLGCHPQATVYAIAEKAADIIKSIHFT